MCGDGMYTSFIKQCGEEELAADSCHTHTPGLKRHLETPSFPHKS